MFPPCYFYPPPAGPAGPCPAPRPPVATRTAWSPRALVDAPLILGLGGDLDYNVPTADDDDSPSSGPALYQPAFASPPLPPEKDSPLPVPPAPLSSSGMPVVGLAQPAGNPTHEPLERLKVSDPPGFFQIYNYGGNFTGTMPIYYRVEPVGFGSTATEGVDYRPLTGVVEMPGDENYASIDVFAYFDDDAEGGGERVAITLLDDGGGPGAGAYDLQSGQESAPLYIFNPEDVRDITFDVGEIVTVGKESTVTITARERAYPYAGAPAAGAELHVEWTDPEVLAAVRWEGAAVPGTEAVGQIGEGRTDANGQIRLVVTGAGPDKGPDEVNLIVADRKNNRGAVRVPVGKLKVSAPSPITMYVSQYYDVPVLVKHADDVRPAEGETVEAAVITGHVARYRNPLQPRTDENGRTYLTFSGRLVTEEPAEVTFRVVPERAGELWTSLVTVATPKLSIQPELKVKVNTSGRVTVTVTDPGGTPLPRVVVELKSDNDAVVIVDKTDQTASDGTAQFEVFSTVPATANLTALTLHGDVRAPAPCKVTVEPG